MSRLFAPGVLALAAVAVLTGYAVAQDQSRRALAERVVEAAYEVDVADRIMEVFWPIALEAIKERAPEGTSMELFLYEGRTAGFADEAAHAGLAPLVDLFARGFSEPELLAIADFYESAAGRKLQEAQGAVSSVLSGAAAEALDKEIRGLSGRIDALLTEDGY